MAGKKYIFTKYDLEKCLKNKNKIAIYGAGEYGKKLVDHLITMNKTNNITCMVVTKKKSNDYDYKGIQVREAAEFLGLSECFVIVAVSFSYLLEVTNEVEKYGKKFCCITRELLEDIEKEKYPDLRKTVPFKGLDFLLAGFSKCGTTSLHKALMNIDDIYLSEKKESALFRWCDKVKNPKEKLIDNYFNNIKEGQIVGMIEPDFSIQADGIFHFFGNQIKIIFCVRNPVDAVFSRFRMNTRLGLEEVKKTYMQVNGVYNDSVFEKYFELNGRESIFVKLGEYVDWIEQFLKYYPKNQIKVIIFEEMIKKPKDTVNDILQFVGSSLQYQYEKLPLENEGNFVMADIDGLKTAEKRLDIYWEYKYPKEIRSYTEDELFQEKLEAEKQYGKENKIYNVKMTTDQRKMLERYYFDSVRKLERLLDKDLSGIWF